MIKIGCSGFPNSQRVYASSLNLVELNQLFDKFPSDTTLNKLRMGFPKEFEFIVCASRLISGQPTSLASPRSTPARARLGQFKATADVDHILGFALKAARVLKSRLIFFTMPGSFTPQADNVGRLHRFFDTIKRDSVEIVWEPPPSWPASLVKSLSKNLRLTQAINPLHEKPDPAGFMRYYRLGDHKKTRGFYQFSKSELREIKAA